MTESSNFGEMMNISELRELGILQEVNRRILAPLGLALQTMITENGREVILGILDRRDDPQGIVFGEHVLDPEKLRKFEKLWEDRKHTRMQLLGHMVEPVPELDTNPTGQSSSSNSEELNDAG